MIEALTLTMRILAITHNFPNEGNPFSGIFAARQLDEMRRQGHEVTVMVPVVWAPSVVRRFRRWRKYNHTWRHAYNGIEPIVRPRLCLPGVWFNPWLLRLAYRALRPKAVALHMAAPFDILYARFLYPDGYAAMRLAEDLKIPAVAVSAGSDLLIQSVRSGRINRDLYRMLEKLDGLVTSGRLAAEKIEFLCGRQPLALHGVVDTEQFRPADDKAAAKAALGLAPDRPSVLYVGTLLKTKGVYELLEAFLNIRKAVPQLTLNICGPGDEYDAMQTVIRNAGAEDDIQLVGPVAPERVSQWMQAADLFVLPSYSEGMPNVVMEAMACGLPVVVTAVGGVPYELSDCPGAILIPPRQVDPLAEAMKKILTDNALQIEMQNAARQKALQRFSVQKNTKTLIHYMEQILNKQSNVLTSEKM